MSRQVRGRGGRVKRPLSGQGALQPKLSTKAKVSERVATQRHMRSGSLLNRKAGSSNTSQNALLAFKLRLYPLNTAAAVVHTAKTIAARITRRGALGGEGSDIEKRNQLKDSRGARGKRLSRLFWAGAPHARAELLQITLEGGNESRTLALRPSVHREAGQTMHAKVVGVNRSGGAFHNNNHVIR